MGQDPIGDPETWRELIHEGLTPAAFVLHFGTTWVVITLFANYFMQVLFIRWRYRGGRLLGGWSR
jgi:hypothetical protein